MTDALIRTATADDATGIERLIRDNQIEGHLLPRSLEEIRSRAERFLVAEADGSIVGCAELAPLSASLAEVRSLVVRRGFRRSGLAARLVGELHDRAKAGGFRQLAALTHDPRFFVRQNFSIVPHLWLPEKVAKDCHGCALFRQCGQYAMVQLLADVGRVRWTPTAPRRVAVA
jgi:amino-acid N-acetyltransferase